MHDDYKPLQTPDGITLERCPLCHSEAALWQYSTSPAAPRKLLACCSHGEPIGPQDGLVNEGCLLYMPPDNFYRETIRDAVRYWNEFAQALTAMRAAADPSEPTDAQRLDWLASKGCVEIEDAYMGPISVQQSGDTLGKGKTLRDALDAAMRRASVKPADGVETSAKAGCWACNDTGVVTTSSNGSGLIEAPCANCADGVKAVDPRLQWLRDVQCNPYNSEAQRAAALVLLNAFSTVLGADGVPGLDQPQQENRDAS
jgi:hypothetical protein